MILIDGQIDYRLVAAVVWQQWSLTWGTGCVSFGRYLLRLSLISAKAGKFFFIKDMCACFLGRFCNDIGSDSH